MASHTPRYLLSSGSNAQGQLGNGTQDDSHRFTLCSFIESPPGTLPANTQAIRHVAGGANHTVLILERGEDSSRSYTELWGCGDGTKGQLGPLSSTLVFRRIKLELPQDISGDYQCRLIAAAWETTYVVLSCQGKSDILVAMGADDFGDLGVGGVGASQQAANEGLYIVNFDHLAHHGRSMRGARLTIDSLAAALHHVVALVVAHFDDGSIDRVLVGWGASRHGQLRPTLANGRPVPFTPLPRIIEVDTAAGPVESVSVGNQHTVIRYSSGRLSAFGSDRKAQLHGLDSLDNIALSGCTWNGTYVVRDISGKRAIISTGSNSKGQLGREKTLSLDALDFASVQFQFPIGDETRLLNMACGSEHVFCLFSIKRPFSEDDRCETEVWGWGWNEHGNLGTGTTEDVHIPVKIGIQTTPTTEERHVSPKPINVWADAVPVGSHLLDSYYKPALATPLRFRRESIIGVYTQETLIRHLHSILLIRSQDDQSTYMYSSQLHALQSRDYALETRQLS